MYASNKLNELQYPTDLGSGKSGWLPHATVSLTLLPQKPERLPLSGAAPPTSVNSFLPLLSPCLQISVLCPHHSQREGWETSVSTFTVKEVQKLRQPKGMQTVYNSDILGDVFLFLYAFTYVLFFNNK